MIFSASVVEDSGALESQLDAMKERSTTRSNEEEITGSQKIQGNPECQIFSLVMSNWNSYPRLNGSLGCWVESNKYHFNQINTYANWDVSFEYFFLTKLQLNNFESDLFEYDSL